MGLLAQAGAIEKSRRCRDEIDGDVPRVAWQGVADLDVPSEGDGADAGVCRENAVVIALALAKADAGGGAGDERHEQQVGGDARRRGRGLQDAGATGDKVGGRASVEAEAVGADARQGEATRDMPRADFIGHGGVAGRVVAAGEQRRDEGGERGFQCVAVGGRQAGGERLAGGAVVLAQRVFESVGHRVGGTTMGRCEKIL